MSSTQKRNSYIDFLRFIGITMIILAHVEAPNGLIQLRSFDVPLMLFVSGLSYANKDLSCNYIKWMQNRFKRLIIPVWLYLIFYFAVYRLLLVGGVIHQDYLKVEIVGSFFLLTGRSIGYVWIYKVFILVMLVTPVLLWLNKKLNTIWFVVVIMLILALNEILLDVVMPRIVDYKAIHYVLNQTLPYLLAYSVPFLLGVRIRNSSQEMVRYSTVSIILIFGLSSIFYYFKDGLWCQFFPYYKYPPRYFFIIYGLSACSALWLVRKRLKTISEWRLVSFIGSNTTWIYLFHILFVTLSRIYVGHWLIRFIVVYSLSVVTYALWYSIITSIRRKKEIPLIKYLVG